MEKAKNGSNFKLFLLCAYDKISDSIHQKYLDYISGVLNPKLKITYILAKPPPIWKGITGFIDEVLRPGIQDSRPETTGTMIQDRNEVKNDNSRPGSSVLNFRIGSRSDQPKIWTRPDPI